MYILIINYESQIANYFSNEIKNRKRNQIFSGNTLLANSELFQ